MKQSLLNLLVCPLCQSRLVYLADKQELVCKADKLAFPIEQDIPILLSQAGRSLTQTELASLHLSA